MNKSFFHVIAILSFSVLIFSSLSAQSNLWQPANANLEKKSAAIMPKLPEIENKSLFKLEADRMIRTTAVAKKEGSGSGATTAIIDLPLPDGTFQKFSVWGSSLMEKGLQEKYAEIKTYIIKGIDDPYAGGRIMASPYEFSAYFASTARGHEVYVRKVYKGKTDTYVSYLGKDAPKAEDWTCNYIGEESEPITKDKLSAMEKNLTTPSTGSELHLFTMAISFPGSTSEANGYTTKAEALAGIVSFLSEINVIYERDVAIRFVLPENEDAIIFLDDATDPFVSNAAGQAWLESQVVQQTMIGADNYDLGMVLVTGYCCAAQRPSVCTDDKELNYSEFRDLIRTAHEIGHQFSCEHSWTSCGTTGGVGRNELGSGSSIMGYPGICGSDNIPGGKDPIHFGAYSRYQIINYTSGLSCGKKLPTGNTPPSVTVPEDGFYIPKGTPFWLAGSGSDVDGDRITYSWEQTNIRGEDFVNAVPVLMEPQLSDGDVPIHRIFNPTSSPDRIIPSLPILLDSSNVSIYERLPTYERGIKYSLYARDNRPGAGGTTLEEVSFNVDDTAGPFVITSQNDCTSWAAGSTQTITWEVANTTNANVNVQNVNILLSTNRGVSWDHTLATSTPNDGNEVITVPAGICSNQIRIKVEAVGNYFFDINDADLSIDDGGSNTIVPSALSFDGVDDYVGINAGVGNFGSGDFTVELQFRTTNNNGAILSKRGVCNVDNFWNLVVKSDGKINFEISEDNNINLASIFSSTAINDGNWHHLAVTRENNTLRLYIDGVEEASRTNAANIDNTYPLEIGKSVCFPVGDYFKGEITEFRLWTVARTVTELTDNPLCRLSGTESGLEVYYPLEITNCGGCGVDLEDATPNGNDGDLVNGTNTIISNLAIKECPSCANGDIAIAGQPVDATVDPGATANFSVSATGSNLSYQWEISTDGGSTFDYIAGANESVYSLATSTRNANDQYRCLIVNGCDVQTTDVVTILFNNCAPLSISSINGPAAPCKDNYYTYYVTPNADVAGWDWSYPQDWDVTFFENMIFVQAGGLSGDLSVTATDACGNTATQTLAVTPNVVEITTQPGSPTVTEGAAAAMSIGVSNGGGTTQYTWQESLDGGSTFANIAAANASTYNIAAAALIQDGRRYRCIVENECLRDTSDVATLTVNCTSSAPTINSGIIGSDVVCGNATLTYQIDPVPGATTYNWTLPGGWSGSSSTNSISVTTNGAGGILKVSAANNCGTSNEVALEIIASPNACAGGANFDGIDDYMTVEQNAQYLDANMTVSFWMRPESLQGQQSLIFNGTEFEIRLDNGQIRYIHSIRNPSTINGGYVDFTFSELLVTNQWRHVTITRNTTNRTISLFLDGSLSKTQQWGPEQPSMPNDNQDYPLTFGAGAAGLISFYHGDLDEVKIWNEERTPAQIQEDQYCSSAGTETNLLAYYSFDQGQPNGDNTGLSGLSNAATAYPEAIPTNMLLTGVASNIVDGFEPIVDVRYADLDNDGFGDPDNTTTDFCSAGNYILTAGDCDDTQPGVNPLAQEICGNNRDDNCNGVVDENTLALNLDGVDDNVSFGNTLGNFGTEDFTIEARIRTTAAENNFILSKRPTCGGTESFWNIQIRFDGSLRIELFPANGGGNTIPIFDVNLADDTWHHFAITRQNGLLKIYVDGIEKASQTVAWDLNNTANLDLGANICGTNLNYKGDIDELRIWNIARTAEEIDAYKNASLSNTQPNLEAYYDFNNPNAVANDVNTGQTTVTDRMGNYDGAMTGFTLNGTSSNWVEDHVGCVSCDVPPTLVITPPAAVCAPNTIDLTAASITAGSDAGILTYFADAELTNILPDATAVGAGTYYIQLTDANGCVNSRSVDVTINAQPHLIITDPAAVCAPNTVDLTAASITAGSEAGTFTYFTDAGLMSAIPNEIAVGAGTYYIQLTDANGCVNSGPVNISVNDTPDIAAVTTQTNTCPATSVELTAITITDNNNVVGTTTTFHSAAPTSSTDMNSQLTSTEITSNQTVYVMAAAPTGCFDVTSFLVEITDCNPVGILCDGTGGIEDYTVPAGVTELTIEAVGAPGAHGSNSIFGGTGGTVTATFNVNPGDVLRFIAGERGLRSGSGGGGGGGSSAVINCGSSGGNCENGVLLMVAGGGGGGAINSGIGLGATTEAGTGGGGGAGFGSGGGGINGAGAGSGGGAAGNFNPIFSSLRGEGFSGGGQGTNIGGQAGGGGGYTGGRGSRGNSYTASGGTNYVAATAISVINLPGADGAAAPGVGNGSVCILNENTGLAVSLSAEAATCPGGDVTYTATVAGATQITFFLDENQNGAVDPGESLQSGNGNANTYASNTLTPGQKLSVIVSDGTLSGRAVVAAPAPDDTQDPMFSACLSAYSDVLNLCDEYVPTADKLGIIATDNCGDVTITFSPAFITSAGTTSVTATATDESGNTATCTFDLTLSANPDKFTLTAVDDSFQGQQFESVSFTVADLLSNDEISSGADLAVENVRLVDASQGTLTPLGNDTYSFTPAPDFFGNATLEYTLKVNSNAVFLESTGHFYEYVPTSGAITWTQARNLAAARRLNGLPGYLVTITSEAENDFVRSILGRNSWIGASDAATEGDWRWVTGPEGEANGGLGTPFWSGGRSGSPVNGAYQDWTFNENLQTAPNNGVGSAGRSEDYAWIFKNLSPGVSGSWNDLEDVQIPKAYVVEYGGAENCTPSITSTANIIIDVQPDVNTGAFITTWKTTTQDPGITIYTNPGLTYDYTIDWGDGTTDNNVTGDISHTYTDHTKLHTVKIAGVFPHFQADNLNVDPRNAHQITSIVQWGNIQWQSMDFMFNNCLNMVYNAIDVPDLSNVTVTRRMFVNALRLNENTDLSGWDMSNVRDMSYMFLNANRFNGDITTWNVSNVRNMEGAFTQAVRFNRDIGGWNVGNVRNMSGLFNTATSFNQDISGWIMSSVTDMNGMFIKATAFNQDIGGWDVSNVLFMQGTFQQASSFNQDISGWNVSKVRNMISMFTGASRFDQNLGAWNITGLQGGLTLWRTFTGSGMSTANYDATLIGWAAQNVANFVRVGAHGLQYCAGREARQSLIDDHGWRFYGDALDETACGDRPFITTWTTTVDDLDITIYTPFYTYDFTVDWGDGDIAENVPGQISHTYAAPGTYEVKISGDFPSFRASRNAYDVSNAAQLKSIEQWGSIKWKNLTYAFQGARNMVYHAKDSPDLSELVNNTLNSMFYGAESMESPDLNGWDVSKVTSLNGIFWDAKNFNGAIGDWDVSNVKDAYVMFYGASSFNRSLKRWDVSQVTTMQSMFNGATSFNQPLDSWDVSQVTTMTGMFNRATSFNQPLDRWNVSKVTNMDYMFYGTTNFNQPISSDGDRWNVSNVTNMNRMFNNATSFNQPLDSWNVSQVTNMSGMFLKATSFNQPLGNWNVSNVTNMSSMFYGATNFDQPLGNWKLNALTNALSMLDFSALSKANYDNTLIDWETNPAIASNIKIGVQGLKYCAGEDARTDLETNKGWSFVGDIRECPTFLLAVDNDGSFKDLENSDAEILTQAFAVYPNPAANQVHIAIKKATPNSVLLIRDQLGRVLWRQALNDDQADLLFSLDISQFQSGMYWVSYQADKEVMTEKLIITK